MSRGNPVLILMIILILFSAGCNNKSTFNPQIKGSREPETRAHQKSISILNMSDLDVIKKSADYLNSKGEKLVFMETQIVYENNPELCSIFHDPEKGSVQYRGDYLVVHFYPPPSLDDIGKSLSIFIDEHGNVLGYSYGEDSD